MVLRSACVRLCICICENTCFYTCVRLFPPACQSVPHLDPQYVCICTTIMVVLTECIFVQSMSASSISLCAWKYNLASSSLRLFKTFRLRSPPNSELCFLSFGFTTHYPGHVEETVFREQRERETLRDSKSARERVREEMGEQVKTRARQRESERVAERERERENADCL